MQITIKEARKIIKQLKKKYECYVHVSIDFSSFNNGGYRENVCVYVESDGLADIRFNTAKEIREHYGLV